MTAKFNDLNSESTLITEAEHISTEKSYPVRLNTIRKNCIALMTALIYSACFTFPTTASVLIPP